MDPPLRRTARPAVPGWGAAREPLFADGMQGTLMPRMLEQSPEQEQACPEEASASCPANARRLRGELAA